MNNAGFWKTLQNVRKHRDVKLFTTTLLATEMKKNKVLMNKPVHLGLQLLELSKILMYEFSYHYVKPKI